MGNKGQEGVREILRVISTGYTGTSRGTGNKRKSPSHQHISFPTKKLPSTLPNL